MQKTATEIIGMRWNGGDDSDTALAYGPAVFMLQQTVDSMRQAKELGAEEEEEEARKRKENFILLIVSVMLMNEKKKNHFLPIIGTEVAATLGFANMARIIAIAGELGNAALAMTYDSINDPSSAVINILGSLFGVGNIARAARGAKGLSDVAQWRKGMSSADISVMGKHFADGDSKVQSILGKVCKL
ncbi:hypothetical protein F4778DRAFT_91579 [Xylariomycetidae sp. FL2044]|nr:hypothetical protein F4778DRAFT_91579 [Xylariomycetidae sp. FL2044]